MCVLCEGAGHVVDTCYDTTPEEGSDAYYLATTGDGSGPSGAASTTDIDDVSLNGLLMMLSWGSTEITYSFSESLSDYPNESNYSGNGDLSTYSPLAEDGRNIFRDAFAAWDDVTALTLTEVPGGTGTPNGADIMLGASEMLSTAWAYGPSTQSEGGDIFVNTAVRQGNDYNALFRDNDGTYNGSYAYSIAMHEIGHSLGLKHPHQGTIASPYLLDLAYDSLEYTVMAYRSYVGDPSPGAYNVEDWHYPQSPMILDIKAIQALYGANYTTRSGATTYRFDPTSGEMWINGVSQGPTGANIVFRTLWDGGGVDTLDLSAYSTHITADLTPGGETILDTTGTAQRALLNGSISNPIHASANIYMSLLYQDNTASLIENVTTGLGDDMILGNQANNKIDPGAGTNVIDGGAGTDTVVIDFSATTIMTSLSNDGLLLSYQNGSALLSNVETIETTSQNFSVAWVVTELTNANVSTPVALSSLGAPISTTFSIQGQVYLDTNENGVFEPGTDSAQAGWTVFIDFDGDALLDNNEVSTLTDANGNYVFSGLTDGTYTIVVQAPNGGGSSSATVNTNGADLTGIDFLSSPSPPQSETVFAEFGTISLLKHNWKTIHLTNDFDTPVVFASVTTQNGTDIRAVRLKNIEADSFEIKLQEPKELDGVVEGEEVSFVVMEAGQWALSDGRLIEVGTFASATLSSAGLDQITLASDFSDTPMVFSDIQTNNGKDFTTVRHDNISSDSFLFAMEEEEALNNGDHATETIGYMAIESGVTIQDNITLEANAVSKVKSGGKSYDFTGAHSADVALLTDLATWDGKDPSTVGVNSLSATSMNVFVQEDQSLDTETNHNKSEVVDFLAFSGTGLMTALDVEQGWA